jgi:hypothetical protein
LQCSNCQTAFVFEQALDVAPCEARDPVEVKIVKCRTEVVALGKKGAPAQSGLKTLQTEFLQQAMIIGDGKTPFGVVMAKKLRCGATPAAACFAIRAHDRCHSACRPSIEAECGSANINPYKDTARTFGSAA